MTRAFRNGAEEGRDAHWYEFAMLEWYRAYASYIEIMEDVENLTASVAHAMKSPVREKLKPPFCRLTVRDAFRECAGVDLEPFFSDDRQAFAAQESASGKFGLAAEDPPDARFFKILVGGVEPELRGMGAVFLVDYPASQAALSKIKPDDPAVCERFELYAGGMELANGFTELNDPVEQRRRFEEEARSRAALGTRPVALDEAFLEALELGMPPAGGVALGLDRLMAVLFGCGEIDPFLPFGRFFG
jgi:lysyl-tRNA synthetase class 2